jgi:2-polyprenyl-3-methyl-5-hydroxy-6-metoxy-1,4-benzoquinol methylase
MGRVSVVTEEFGREFWEERYSGHAAAGEREPSAHLVAEVRDLAPGTALDAGCGEGAEAIWLAGRGWRVTAVDITAAALDRAREHARGTAGQIDWVQADLTAWTPPPGRFDLVCAHYVHPAGSRQALLARLAAAVAPGGTLLVVEHAHAASHGAGHDPSVPAARVGAAELAAALDPARWEVAVTEPPARQVSTHDGRQVPLRDVILRARRR